MNFFGKNVKNEERFSAMSTASTMALSVAGSLAPMLSLGLSLSLSLGLSLLLVFAGPLRVAGESFLSNPIEISGRHVIENNREIKSGRHTFVLTASGDVPMPEGSSGGVKRVTINSNEEFSFGSIVYEKPGSYEYTVSREIVESDELIQEDATYKCKVEVIADMTAVVVFEKIGTEGKPNRIEYRDTYIPPKDEDPDDPTPDNPEPSKNTTPDNPDPPGNTTQENPNQPDKTHTSESSKKSEVPENKATPVFTGDGSSQNFYICCLILSLILIIYIRKKRRSEFKKE